jgi:hypothetical protein
MQFLIIGAIIGIVIAIINVSLKSKKSKALLTDERFKNAKIFKSAIKTPIAISEEGFIGIINVLLPEPTVIHIKDINGFDLIVDGQNVANIGGAVVGGLLFGGIGALIGASSKKEKINKITLVFKLNNFNNPTMEIPLLVSETKKGSMIYNMTQEEIRQLLSTLEYVEKKYKENQ